jgi:ribosomal protein S18 acetylase RimI-like enzyme
MTVVRRAGAADIDAVVHVLCHGFMDDPVNSCLFPERAHREAASPGFYELLVRSTLVTGEIDVTDDVRGVALWHSIAVPVDPTIDTALYERVFTPVCGERSTRRLILLSQALADRHPQREPHCHLQFLAVHPENQGTGHGSTLLRHRLALLDADRTPAYLEATSPRNRALYDRFGFVAEGDPVTVSDSPELFPMWRAPSDPVSRK